MQEVKIDESDLSDEETYYATNEVTGEDLVVNGRRGSSLLSSLVVYPFTALLVCLFIFEWSSVLYTNFACFLSSVS